MSIELTLERIAAALEAIQARSTGEQTGLIHRPLTKEELEVLAPKPALLDGEWHAPKPIVVDPGMPTVVAPEPQSSYGGPKPQKKKRGRPRKAKPNGPVVDPASGIPVAMLSLYSEADVRSMLRVVQSHRNRGGDGAKDLLKKHTTDGATVISKLPVENYAALIAEGKEILATEAHG